MNSPSARGPLGLRLQLALVFALGSLSVLLIATGILYRGFTGEIRNRDQLLLASEALFKNRFNIEVRTRHEAIAIDREKREIDGPNEIKIPVS